MSGVPSAPANTARAATARSATARYVLLRLLRAAATVWAAITLVFILVRAVPGDPATAILGDTASPEAHAALREALLLDRPLPEQYLVFLGSVLDGSLGHSYRVRDREVATDIAAVMPHTMALTACALAIGWLIALPLGTFAALARRKGQRFGWDLGARALTSLGVAVPTIALGPLAILLFCIQLRVLPMPGDQDAGFLGLILPSSIVGIALAASLTRQTRAQMLEKLSEPYVMAARARGLSERSAALRHALRNAAVPVLTLGAAQLGALLSGSVILERLFERPGLGSLLLDAFGARDIPVVQGCALVVAILYVLVNLGSDLLLLAIDPRVRLS